MLSFSQLFLSPLSPSSRGCLVPLHFLPLKCYYLHNWGFFIFLPSVLIPACDSSSLAFCIMYSEYKLNNQDDNIQPWLTPLPILNQSFVPCPFLTVASCPAYRFLRRQVSWSDDIHISLRISQFAGIHTVKDFSVINEAEVDFFVWNFLAFSMIQQMLAI